MFMKDGRFHHGNLREEFLEVAMQSLVDSGVEELSLRRVAQQLGVSSAAPYRHFKNKEALIVGLIEKGAEELTRSYEQALESEQTNEQKLRQACAAYLQYAEEKPHLFKLMLTERESRNKYVEHSKYSDVPIDDVYAFQIFEQLVSQVIPSTGKTEVNRQVTISCWALLHGFATLHMGGHLETVNYQKTNAIDSVVAFIKSSGGS
jgi:AcrR family transcriptional regulator